MSARRTIYATVDRYDSLVSGDGSRELVESVTGRSPVRSSIRRGWVVQEHTCRDVIALASLRGYDVVISGPRTAAAPVVASTSPTVDEVRTSVGLW